MSIYAVDFRSPTDKKRPASRKREPEVYDPLHKGAQTLSYHLYESALALSKILAPDHPADAEPLPDDIQWQILERVGFQVTPHMWDDPRAIEDLIRLRRKFAPASAARSEEYLKAVAKLRRTEQRNLPDLNETPLAQEPEERRK